MGLTELSLLCGVCRARGSFGMVFQWVMWCWLTHCLQALIITAVVWQLVALFWFQFQTELLTALISDIGRFNRSENRCSVSPIATSILVRKSIVRFSNGSQKRISEAPGSTNTALAEVTFKNLRYKPQLSKSPMWNPHLFTKINLLVISNI
jgi:hypothetical protein